MISKCHYNPCILHTLPHNNTEELFHPIITTPCQSQSKIVMRPLSTMVLTPILILLPSPHYRQDMTRQQREDSSMHKHYAKPNEFPKKILHGAELTIWGTVGGCSIY